MLALCNLTGTATGGYSHSETPIRQKQKLLKPRKNASQARSRQTVEVILEAAAHLLDHGGYARLNTNAIAVRAGVSIGSLYQYFPNKEAICAELARRYLRRQTEAFADNLADTWRTDRGEQIRRTVRATVGIARSDMRAALILYKHLRFLPEHAGALKARREMEQTLRERYESPPPGQRLRNPDIAAFFVVNVMGALLGETLEQRPEWLQEQRFIEELSILFIGYLSAASDAVRRAD